ncbi:MAG: galactokinase [Selenomonadaceae bacterium]|nr:galactokinase [Selenomonadaceae bacterium]
MIEIMNTLKAGFVKYFGEQKTTAFFSPGRVNLIGEHTDYNGGHVFPCAISLGTYALVAPRQDMKTRAISLNYEKDGIKEFSMENLSYDESIGWANYIAGVVKVFEDAGMKATCGFDIALYGNLPSGAGLSSSASLEVLMGVILKEFCGFEIEMIEIVKLGQKAENQFVGVNCGIMDQFAVGMGKKDCAILLDCNTLKYRYSKLDLRDACIVITNTNKPHSLNDSEYNLRRQQCEHALKQLQEKLDITSLGDLANPEFDFNAELITDEVERRRAHHAVYENRRTLTAVEALELNDIQRFGELMRASHESLRDDYEVTCKELDTLAELAWQQPGVIGSRMTGGGFGGSTVSIVKKDAVEDFKAVVGKKYTEIISYAPSFYVADIADGTRKL